MLSALGSGISAAGNAIGTQYRADQAYDLGMAKLDAAQAMQGMGLGNGNGMQMMAVGSNGQPYTVMPVGGLSYRTADAGDPPSGGGGKKEDNVWPGMAQPSAEVWENKKPESSNVFPPSWGWVSPPGYPNASSVEDWGGEWVGDPYGLYKAYETMQYNLTGSTYADKVRAVGKALTDTEWFKPWKNGPNPTRYAGTPYSMGSMSP